MIIVILQARMGSTRLPNKVLMDISGRPMLWHIIDRLKHCKSVDRIVVATSSKTQDKPIITLAKEMEVSFFAGSEDDVLDRFYRAAEENRTDTIIRITGDCPFVDPVLIDSFVEIFKDTKDVDYLCNTNPPTYPDGLDIEIFTFEALKKVWSEARMPFEREHVTAYIYNHPKIFKIKNIENDKDLSDLRLCVDNKEDIVLVRKIYEKLHSDKIFLLDDILGFLSSNPDTTVINRHIKRNEGYIK